MPVVARIPSTVALGVVWLAIGSGLAAGNVEAQSASTACDVTGAPGGELAEAKALYAERCPSVPRRDCDPVDGAWQCSSQVIGSGAPVRPVAEPVIAPVAVPTDAPPEVRTPSPTGTVAGARSCDARATDLDEAKRAFEQSCPELKRVDCDPIGDVWQCSSAVLGARAPGGRGSSSDGDDPTPEAPPNENIVIVGDAEPEPDVSTAPPPGAGRRIGRIGENDLLALMYDNCPDRDDGHAVAAGKAVLSRVGGPVPWVVNGTCGARIQGRYQRDSVNVLRAVWGDSWLDAAANRGATVAASADSWASVLANGADVWVAEGGPSDVTAEILRRIEERYPSLDLKRVRVVQHSDWNEDQTSSRNLAYVRRATDYRKIPDGNAGGNGSAALNPGGSRFRSVATRFAEIATSGPFATEWRAAFDYLPPGCPNRKESCKLDFSDTVELLYIVGDDSTRDATGFAERYLR